MSMNKRTAEIIMVCKGQHDFGDFPVLKQAIAAYMSDRCVCPVERYTDEMLNNIIWTAAMDYVDSMKEYPPSQFFCDVKRAMGLHNNPFSSGINRIDMYEAMCIAFMLTDVQKKDRGYINGFNEENTRFVKRSGKASS